MRILVLSDSHRNIVSLKGIIEKHNDIQHVFFLGDFVSDIESLKGEFREKLFYIVSGNCDYSSIYKSAEIVTIENTRIFLCHGHRQNVKYTLETLKNTARQNNCKIALFGHTHKSLCSYDDGLYLINPGSVSSSREGPNSYAIIDITKQGIMPSILTVK